MAPEFYSIFVVEAAAVAVLLLITALLYRDNPQGWLFLVERGLGGTVPSWLRRRISGPWRR